MKTQPMTELAEKDGPSPFHWRTNKSPERRRRTPSFSTAEELPSGTLHVGRRMEHTVPPPTSRLQQNAVTPPRCCSTCRDSPDKRARPPSHCVGVLNPLPSCSLSNQPDKGLGEEKRLLLSSIKSNNSWLSERVAINRRRVMEHGRIITPLIANPSLPLTQTRPRSLYV